MSKRRAAADIALAILWFLVTAFVAAIIGGALFSGSPLTPALIAQAILVVGGIQALLAWRSQQWRDIGLRRPTPGDVPRGLLALALCLAMNGLLMAAVYVADPDLIPEHLQSLRGVSDQLTETRPVPVVLLALLFVGFYEEVLARGLLLSRARQLLGGIWPPVLLSSVLFGLGHLYQGPLGAVQTTAIGILFAALTLRWGTLWPVILAHIALNTMSVAAIDRFGALALGR